MRTQATGTGSATPAESWGLISEVEITDGNFITTLRSVVRVSQFSQKIFFLKLILPSARSNFEMRTNSFVIFQVYNHFNVSIHVYYMKNGKSSGELCEAGIVEPMQHLNLPVHVVYSSKCQLFFAPERYVKQSQIVRLFYNVSRTIMQLITSQVFNL